MGKKKVAIQIVKKDFNINDGIELPKNISYSKVDDCHLFVAPEKATWITTSDIGKDIVEYFSKGFKIKQVIEAFKAQNIPLEKIINELRDLLVKIERKGFLRSAMAKEESPDISLQLFLTNKCNLRCRHCYMDAGVALNSELTADELFSILDDFSKIHQTKVVFSGGEPLLHPDFFKLAERAKSNNLMVELFTNGTLIDEKKAKELESCVDEIQFSLDGATPKVNDEIRGNGVFHKVIRSIKLLEKTKIKLRLGVVLMPQNIVDFKENVEEFSKLIGDVEIKFGFANTEGRASQELRFESASIGEKEVQKILEILYRKKLNVMTKYEPNIIVRNCGYGESIAISSEGDIFPCSILKPKSKAGNIRTDDLRNVIRKINEDTMKSNVENLEKCHQCDLRYICFGGCRLNNISKNNDLLIPHCTPEIKTDIYKRLVTRDKFDAINIWLGYV